MCKFEFWIQHATCFGFDSSVLSQLLFLRHYKQWIRAYICQLYGISCAEVGWYTGHRENIYLISRGIINQLMYLFRSVTLIAIYLFNDTCSRGSSFGVMTRLRTGRPRSRNSIPGRGNRFFSSPKLANRLWGPPRLLHIFTGYQ
jgi:hypothetical protein